MLLQSSGIDALICVTFGNSSLMKPTGCDVLNYCLSFIFAEGTAVAFGLNLAWMMNESFLRGSMHAGVVVACCSSALLLLDNTSNVCNKAPLLVALCWFWYMLISAWLSVFVLVAPHPLPLSGRGRGGA